MYCPIIPVDGVYAMNMKNESKKGDFGAREDMFDWKWVVEPAVLTITEEKMRSQVSMGDTSVADSQ